jgi:cell division protein ZapA
VKIVSINIRGTNYNLACNEGEEQRLTELSEIFREYVSDMATKMPRANDALLFLMAGLTLQDQVLDLNSGKPVASNEDNEKIIDDSVAGAIDAIAEYIENLADSFEKK